MIKVSSRDLESNKRELLEEVLEKFKRIYPNVDGEAYMGYPIYFNQITREKTAVDMALITKIGVFIFNILEISVPNYDAVQDDIYCKVKEKLMRLPELRSGRDLKFDFTSITISTYSVEKKDNHPIAFNTEQAVEFMLSNVRGECFSEFDYNAIISAVQEAYGINNRKNRIGANPGTKAYAINEANSLIERYDHEQMEAILGDMSGIQRIRGMAGSGKTVVLARKAVEIFMAHRDWTIVVTYSTRALKDQLVRYISQFYACKNDGEKYDENHIRIMQAWGSATAPGVYYEVCKHHNLTPLNYTEAKMRFGKQQAFSRACEAAMNECHNISKMYDCILVDEAQDFDKNFLSLCLKVLDQNERLVYAYDELQKLNDESMPTPKEIFGKDIMNDTPLRVCYRNQSPVIVTAHAIGMGLYREGNQLPLQIPGSPKVWYAIGYESDNEIIDGQPVTLFRTKETSPEFLKVNKNEIIEFIAYNDFLELQENLVKFLIRDIEEERLLPSDIMIIDMDAVGSMNNRASLMSVAYSKGENSINIHMAGSLSPEDFFRDDSIVYSSIFRAKGNETFMVYIVNAQRCINSLVPRGDRNALFTAITRSKGWVKVMGYGEEMQSLCKEFERVKENDYMLKFIKYPTEEERNQMILNNQDLDENTFKSLQEARSKVAKLKASGQKVNNLQLMMEIMGVSTKEELLSLLNELQ